VLSVAMEFLSEHMARADNEKLNGSICTLLQAIFGGLWS